MRRVGTHERRALGGSRLLPPGPALGSTDPSAPTTDFSQGAVLDAVASLETQTTFSQGFDVAIVASAGIPVVDVRLQVAQMAMTLSGTMRASGTTPPVVLLKAGSQSLSFAAGAVPGFWVDILAGALTFDLSFNSGASVTFAAQTIPVGGGDYTIPSGTYAGMIITFPLGTYNADNLFEGAVASFMSSDSNHYSFTMATVAIQPVFKHASSNPGGIAMAALRGAGAQFIETTSATVLGYGTGSPALSVGYYVTYDVADANGWVFAWATTASANSKRRFGQINTGLGRETQVITDSTPTGSTCTCNETTVNTAHTVTWAQASGNVQPTCRSNKVAQTQASSVTIGTLVPNNFAIMAEHDNAADTFLTGYFYDGYIKAAQQNTTDQDAMADAMTAGTPS